MQPIRAILVFCYIIVFTLRIQAQEIFEEVSLNNPDFTTKSSAHGVSVADYDNDGDDDFLILTTKEDESIKLFRNDGDFNFEEVAVKSGLNIKLKSKMAVWFDANNDGWLDIYIGSTNANKFFKNNGDGTFSDFSEASGLKTVSFGMAFMVGDLNADQLLDIYVTNLYEENQLFLNHGNSTFYNHIKNSGAEIGKLPSMGGVMFDYDLDGDLDIYCIYDQFEPNKLFINDGTGIFNNRAGFVNADHAGFGMGVDFADFNHDSKYDLYLSYYSNNRLLIQQQDGTFEDMAASTGLADLSMSWGVLCADINNDTFTDIFFSNSINTAGINQLFFNDGQGGFDKPSITSPLSNPSNSYGCAYSDLNSDGFLDLIVANSGQGGIQVFRNLQSSGNWLELNLIGTTSNKFGVGTRVELLVNGEKLVDEVTVGSGYASQNSFVLHFGLGPAEIVDSITIYWPDNSIEKYAQLQSNTKLLAIQNESLEIFDSNRYRTALLNENTIPNPTLLKPESTISGTGYSVPRLWNEAMLDAIRTDLARPTIHARNLFHTSVAMYDAWAVYDDNASTYLLGKSINGFYSPFTGIKQPENKVAAQEEAISYAAFRLLNHRFKNSPSALRTHDEFSKLFILLGYDEFFTSRDYSNGSPAALGNYIAQKIIEFGHQDGSNEQNLYANKFYQPKNNPFYPLRPGDSSLVDPNHWQPLAFDTFIDQAGNEIGKGVPEFLSPEWGSVIPFSMDENDLTIKEKDGYEYWVYHDPGAPPLIDTTNSVLSEDYKWGFTLVALWSSQLDPLDETTIDISPGAQGNINYYPTSIPKLKDFYNEFEGGDIGKGYDINPVTGKAYTPQVVKRSDYARVLAEFWADGPESETPPGHWFTILNYVSDHPLTQKRFGGEGPELSDLDWDIKSYFILGGAMHDAAIAAWGIKGYYDFIRPISAIRYMVSKGQCTSQDLPNYHQAGIPLIEGYIELIKADDVLAGTSGEFINEIKIKAWKGPHFIDNPDIDVAGVDWIYGANWSPYQRPSFVTPPFAGFISGHSTFSRAGAEILTRITGNEYFPGGMSEFMAERNEFLVFEEGPTANIILQWAKYIDASDQCSLSRIWGGIHPPADDIPGRLIGKQIGQEAFEFALTYFNGVLTSAGVIEDSNWQVFPNPIVGNILHISFNKAVQTSLTIKVINLSGYEIMNITTAESSKNNSIELYLPSLSSGVYLLQIGSDTRKIIVN
ncbi:MAG: hypothetical protein ACJA08_000045 [Cyclobacteriaceae bacterium]|jgi:hypothetical protein